MNVDGERRENNSQTPFVSALILNGLFVSRLNSASRVSSRAVLSTNACPGADAVTRPSGTDLQQRNDRLSDEYVEEDSTHQIVSLSAGLAGPSSRKRSWRTLMPVDVSVTVSTGNPIYTPCLERSQYRRNSHLLSRPSSPSSSECRVLENPLSVIKTTNELIDIPVASPMPSHKSRETVFEYTCFLR